MLNTRKKAYLLLENGTIFEGKSFGVEGRTVGEVVFATGMTGYQETLTDASYYGQIVTQTFPLIGNYGTNHEDFESKKSWVKGYIVREYCEAPSNFRKEDTIDSFLKEQNVIGLYDIDTRSLTRIIRESGVMNGMITTEDPSPNKEELLKEIRDYHIKDAVESVSTQKEAYFPAENGRYEVALLDFGYKQNILRCLLQRGCNVHVLPAFTAPERIKKLAVDGIMLSNGPGDPAENKEIIENLRKLMEYKIPTFGICLGHQLLALANGAKTEKLKYGHRGANQPVIDIERDRTYVTSQNHGYAVVSDSIDPEIGQVSHKNANDGTCEGVRYHNAPAFTVQFHPEACGGPKDTSYLFDEFVELMDGGMKECR